MSIVTYNNRSIANISAIPGAAKALTHIKTLTASSDSTLSFVDGSDDVVLDSTYPIYKFVYFNIHPSIDDRKFQVNFRDGGSSFDATKTSSAFNYYHNESGSATGLGYSTGLDLAQSTSAQLLSGGLGTDNDQCCVGEILLFNPSSTTFVKHYLSINNNYEQSNFSEGFKIAGYCNTTSAIDGVQFSMNEGNIDSGTIKLYGIKDS